MAQKRLGARSKTKSSGALRKLVGEAKRKTVRAKKSSIVGNYIDSVEAAMASRVPSDQRSKLHIVKSSGPPTNTKTKNKKKPLTRGRTRKSERKK